MKTIALILIGAVFLITSFPLIQGQAGGPYTEETIINDEYTIRAKQLCPFKVTARIEGVMVMKVWFDENGSPVRGIDNYRQTWTYSANGITLKANTGGPSHITFISPTEVELRYAGSYTLVTAAGKGVVFGSAGQGYEYYSQTKSGKWVMTDSTFVSGINTFWDPTQFCAALTP
jgi:hypothetical protein